LKMKKIFLVFLTLLTLLWAENTFIKNLIKSNGEIAIEEYLRDLDELIYRFHIKLNKRNPSNCDKSAQESIEFALKNHSFIHLNGYDENPVEILKLSLERGKRVPNRNDYLIIGLHNMIYKAFFRDKFKITALSYDLKKLEKLYINLQIIFWQISTYKDKNGNYLFLTWQKNWQIELQKMIKNGMDIQNALVKLPSLKNEKESLFESSNMSFSMIYAKIFYIMQKIIKACGGEPKEIGTNVLKTIALSPLF